MLVKVQSSDGGWILIDGARDIEFSGNTRFLKKDDEIKQLVDHNACDKTILAFNGELPLRVKTIKFNTNDISYFILFSTVVFICDDNGKTIESIRIRDR